MNDDVKFPLDEPASHEKLQELLRDAVPQVFSEGKIDFGRLKAVLGESVDSGQERYGMGWAGKSAAFANVQSPGVGTLLPMPEESLDWDNSGNLIIEGDNLEVLKLLQKAYHGRVKMIYIDPPYNTGNEFIYPDDYREGLDDYLRYSGQVAEDGTRQSTNTDKSGRFHSKWLSMMYPRLFLARNLLREDGVIFVSIDDNEVHNLRMLMNEVFGEENFIAQLVWKSRQSEDTRAKTGISTDHEYILAFGRGEATSLRGVDKDLNKFDNPDNDPRGPWRSADLTGLATREGRPNLHYELIDPLTSINYGCPPRGWRYEPAAMAAKISEGRILFPPSGKGRPRHKLFLNDMRSLYKNMSSIITASTTADGTRECNDLLGTGLFSFPKPSALLKLLISQVATEEDDIVLDFFAGSGTTGHAVLALNEEDGVQRKFVLVQLPEKTGKEDYPTIAHITRMRVRRFVERLESANGRGFRAFALSASNFKIWDSAKAGDTSDKLTEQLNLYADNVQANRGPQDVLYELILKSGLPLSAKVEQVEVAGGVAWSVDSGQLLVCLENPLTPELLRGMLELKPARMLCLDTAFGGNDALKTNTVLQAKAQGVAFRTV